MMLSLGQLTVIILLITAVVGFMRGWAADVITAAIVLGTLLFLTIGGGTFLTSALVGSASTNSCNNYSNSLSDLIFGGMTGLAYYAGNKHGSAPATPNQRIAGIIPGAITGGAISFYLSQHFATHAQGFLNFLNALSFLTALPLLIVLGIIGLVSALFVSRNGKAAKAH